MKIETFIKNLLEHNPVHQLKKELIEYIIEYHNNSLNKKVLLSEIYDLSIVDYYSIKADVSKYCSLLLETFQEIYDWMRRKSYKMLLWLQIISTFDN